MRHGRKFLATTLLAAVLGLAVAVPSEPVEAGQPAPLPTQIPIRDVSAPPTPNTPVKPFAPKPTRGHRRAKPPRKRAAPHPAPSPKAALPAPAGNAAGPKLEQRFEAATESIFPLGPEPGPAPAALPAPGKAPDRKPAPVEFPPEPAPAAAPAPAK